MTNMEVHLQQLSQAIEQNDEKAGAIVGLAILGEVLNDIHRISNALVIIASMKMKESQPE